MSLIKTNRITTVGGKPILNSTGSILQVVSTDFSTPVSTTLFTPTDIDGFSASLTPSSSSNKILVYVSVRLGSVDDAYPYIALKRNGTIIGSPTQATGSRIDTFLSFTQTNIGAGIAPFRTEQPSKMYLDSPATTSAVLYQIALSSPYNAATAYINRQDSQVDAAYIQYANSNITIMEISA